MSWIFSLAHAQLVHGIDPSRLGYDFDPQAWNTFVDGMAAYALIAHHDVSNPRILDAPGHFCTVWTKRRLGGKSTT